jgi:hypothetical protein
MTTRYYARYIDGKPVDLLVTGNPSGTLFGEGWVEISFVEFESARVFLGDFTKIQSLFKDEIDAFAGEVRMRFITASPGQSETYIMKAFEAKELKSLGYPESIDPELYPLIHAEKQVDNTSTAVCCETILYMEKLWKTISANIELIRLTGKKNVANATNYFECATAREQTISLLDQIGR